MCAAHSSDSEDQCISESKSSSRTPPSGHRYQKHGEPEHSHSREHHARTRWTFQMCKCHDSSVLTRLMRNRCLTWVPSRPCWSSGPGEDEQSRADRFPSGETAGHQESLPLAEVWGGLHRPETQAHEEEGEREWVLRFGELFIYVILFIHMFA